MFWRCSPATPKLSYDLHSVVSPECLTCCYDISVETVNVDPEFFWDFVFNTADKNLNLLLSFLWFTLFLVSSYSLQLNRLLLLLLPLFSLCGPIREPQYANVLLRMSYFFINSQVCDEEEVCTVNRNTSDVELSLVCVSRFFFIFVKNTQMQDCSIF